MAPAPTTDQREFVRAVLDHLGITPTELGDRLGKRNAYNAVNAWVTDNPKNFRRLRFEDTMRMLELCGWLSVTGEKPTLKPLPLTQESPVADALTEILANQTAAMNALVELRAELGLAEPEPKPRRAAPKRKPAR